MRVVCIDDSIGKIHGTIPNFKFGELLEVIQSDKWENYCVPVGREQYDEYGRLVHWNKKRFIPISNIDETELVNQKQESY